MKESSKKNRIIIIVVLLVIGIAGILGFIIYNTPSNRLARQLDLGAKYLGEQNYEQAVVEFDKAIAIDPMNERAYIGKAEAYVGMGDYEQAAATYATAVQTIPDGNDVWNAAEQFYLDYAQIYIDDGDLVKAVEILEEGDALLNSDRLKDKLDEVRARQEELEREREEEQLDARVQECLRQIYEQMVAGNYKEAVNIFNSFFTLEEEQGILLSQEKYFYFPDGNMTGTGIGLYACLPEVEGGQYEWYVYYGDYVNGGREGNGVYLLMGGSNVESVFTCEWSNDAPNGYGEWAERWDNGQVGVIDMERRMTGNFRDGLLDGEGYCYFRNDNVLMEYEFTFSAVEGVPEERTEEYFAFATEIYRRIYQGLEWQFDSIYDIPYEGAYTYAYCEDLTMQQNSYSYHSFWILPGETIGVHGFADVDMLDNTKSFGANLNGGILE